MEEKEPIKIKLSTVLLIIAVIVIILMGVFIGFLYKQNVENVKSDDSNFNTENVEKTFSEYEIKEVLQKYLNLCGAYQGEPYAVLYVMKEITGKNVINDKYPDAIEDGEISILPTNIKYSEFKEFMLNYMTEELYNTDFARGYVDKDGDLYCKTYGATGIQYEVKSIEKQNNSETKYKGKIITIFEVDAKEEGNMLFEIENINNKCVISSITFPGEIQEDVDENDSTANTSNTSEIESSKQNSSNKNTQNTSKNNTQTTSSVSKDTTKNKIIGTWKADKVVDSNGNDLGLSAVWGTGIRYSNEMKFKADGILSYAIGITASSDDGKYTISGNTIKYGLPTDIKGKMNWSTLTYIPEEDILKEEVDVVGEKAIVTYIRANKNENNKIDNKTDKYKEITKTLEGDDVLEVTNSISNDDGTYTLKGKIYVVDTSKEQLAEYPFRKYNGEYMEITVPKDTKCVYSIDSYEEKTSTVEKVFSRQLAFGNCFNFEFKNGKCVSVYEVVVGH